MPRHGLSDEAWELLEPLFPDETASRVGHPWNPHRPILDAIFWILMTGAAWRDLPAEYGPWQTVYDRFRRWQRDGTWDVVLQTLQLALKADGRLDGELWCIDGTVVRAARAAGGALKKTSCRGNRKTTPWATRAGDSRARSIS
jgi:transposase